MNGRLKDMAMSLFLTKRAKPIVVAGVGRTMSIFSPASSMADQAPLPEDHPHYRNYSMKVHSLLLSRFFLLMFVGNTYAASFDCGKASSEVEKIICSDAGLSKLDESLDEAYRKALKRTDMREEIIQGQREWLKNVRNACQDSEGLRKAYEARIEELGLPSDQPEVRRSEYVLVMSKNDCVCQHMLKIYNEDLRKYGAIRYDQHEEFKAIKWERQKSYLEGITDRTGLIEHDTLISRFDINNDGSPEIIIKDEHRTLRSMDSDAIYIFREKDFADFKAKIVINEAFFKKAAGVWGNDLDKNPFKGNVYALHELPPRRVRTTPTRPEKHLKSYYYMGAWFYFHPFVYQDNYFTSMHDWLPDVGEEWDTAYEKHVKKKWEVILRLTSENQLEDVCYLLKVSDCRNKKGD